MKRYSFLLALVVIIGTMSGCILDLVPRPLDLSTVECPEGYWVYDGRMYQSDTSTADYEPYMLVRNSREIFGYELLSTNAQYAFDLFYGEYFSAEIRSDKETFRHFTLPYALTSSEVDDVFTLYDAATMSYSYRPYRYECADDVVGKINHRAEGCPCKDPSLSYHFYAGGKIFAREDRNTAFDNLLQRADAILAGMDTNFSDAQKCRYISEKIADSAVYYTDNYIGDQFQKGNITIMLDEESFITAYGVLIEGEGNCFGYARAFDLLAKRAGLTSIIVLAWNENDSVGHAWNAVNIDGQWYQVDTTWIDAEDGEPYRWEWLLFEGSEPEHRYYNNQTYAWISNLFPEYAETAYQNII